jgi:taurine transport system ATP-binding protein
LLNAMAGFLPLSSGSITLNGRAVEGPGKERGVVFQKDTLLPWKTVAENVALGLKFAGVGRKERRERALDLLGLVGLQDFGAAAPYELSGGMRQRVGIARALAPEPDILLMDEPFGALDSMTREAMQELLVDVWARTRKQIFFITHSIEEALFLGTHLIVMSPRPGRIVARFDLNFVKAFARDRDARAIKTAPEFVALREEIRAIVHQNEALRTAAQ